MIVRYPGTRIGDETDTLAGVSFPDPYRWLEQDNEEVRRWQRTQSELASSYVREWPHFDRLRQLVARFSTKEYVAEVAGYYGMVPRYAAGRWFRMRVVDDASQAQAVVANEPLGDGRVLFDPMAENPERPPFLSWIVPSPDGCTLALGICVDGGENNTIWLIDVTTGRPLADPPPQTLMDSSTRVQWLPDSSGFFFTAITGAATDFLQDVYLHRRSPAPTTIPMHIAWTDVKESRWVVVSRDGQYAVAFERAGNPIPVAVAALDDAPLRWRSFVTSIVGTVAGHLIGERYIAVTDVGAPRGRVVAIALDADNPNDPESWQELVGESDATLRTVTPVGEALYLSELVDTYARVRIADLDGKHLGEVPMPGRGAVGAELLYPGLSTLPIGHPEKFLFAFSSLTVSPGIYSHTPGQEGVETLQAPHVRLENTVVEDRWAVSADGTRIPYHLVRRTDVDAGQPQPTLIWAYGGYNAPLVPHFPGPKAAFVAVGGVYVHAHLRGGGEFGLEWWHGGRLENKQNCYDDLYAVAEDLIAANRCTPKSLAVTGGSAGGLMAGVAVTQRPDLWEAVVPRVPILDLIGGCRFPFSRMNTMKERANVDEPDEVRRLATFSPYHLVQDGICYPAVFLDAGAIDPRCPPWHARKFAARLQRATTGNAPILLHVWENVGHGLETDKNVAVTEHTEWLAFTMRHLGLNVSA